jgi:hypothetical protein
MTSIWTEAHYDAVSPIVEAIGVSAGARSQHADLGYCAFTTTVAGTIHL